jgi:hypothetical protein
VRPARAGGTDTATARSPAAGSPPPRSPGRTGPGNDRLSALYPALMDADDRRDAQALARLGWALFEMASRAQIAHRETVAMLDDVCIAARVATAGRGSPASLALLRAVLARHGRLPPGDATPLQVLAAANRSWSATKMTCD